MNIKAILAKSVVKLTNSDNCRNSMKHLMAKDAPKLTINISIKDQTCHETTHPAF